MTKYLKNAAGGVHAVTDEHFARLQSTVPETGDKILPAGWTELSEAKARTANPQLFGASDPTIVLTDDELIRALNREDKLAELKKRREAAAEAAKTE